jgi:predicted regulator of Ras-like GTPase activity (Roadblock/LC7/MglB family)
MRSVLQEVIDRIPETLGAAVVGIDGIPVEKIAVKPSFNIDLASAEWIGLVRKTISSLRSQAVPGGLEEITVVSGAGVAILRSIGGDYYLCVVVGPNHMAGRVRYEVWRAGLQLEQALA